MLIVCMRHAHVQNFQLTDRYGGRRIAAVWHEQQLQLPGTGRYRILHTNIHQQRSSILVQCIQQHRSGDVHLSIDGLVCAYAVGAQYGIVHRTAAYRRQWQGPRLTHNQRMIGIVETIGLQIVLEREVTYRRGILVAEELKILPRPGLELLGLGVTRKVFGRLHFCPHLPEPIDIGVVQIEQRINWREHRKHRAADRGMHRIMRQALQ